MDKFYLTDNIYLQDNKLFYEENNKIKNIKPNNWHTFLKDYGWEKLNLKWIKKLNSLTKLPPKIQDGVRSIVEVMVIVYSIVYVTL